MAYNAELADRIREYLSAIPNIRVEEKKMFGGLAFMVNDKMCVNVSGENLMCRFDPALTEVIAEKNGFLPMKMKGKAYKGYCYIEPNGFRYNSDFEFWMNMCLEYNNTAKSSKAR